MQSGRGRHCSVGHFDHEPYEAGQPVILAAAAEYLVLVSLDVPLPKLDSVHRGGRP